MIILQEDERIRAILEKADTTATGRQIDPEAHCVVVELSNIIDDRSEIEGTLVYFPGIRAKDLLRRSKA